MSREPLPRCPTALALQTAAGRPAQALVVCAKTDASTGLPRENAKLVLRAACKPGKETAVGIEISGSPGTDGAVRFTGVNVQVVNGTNGTEGPVNGLGNLIVGYNEDTDPPNDHTGSHNLVVGPDHSFTSYGGLVAGC